MGTCSMQRDGLLTVAPYKPRTIVPTGAAENKHITRKLKLESDDGSVGYVEAPDGFRIERYVDAPGPLPSSAAQTARMSKPAVNKEETCSIPMRIARIIPS